MSSDGYIFACFVFLGAHGAQQLLQQLLIPYFLAAPSIFNPAPPNTTSHIMLKNVGIEKLPESPAP